MTSDPDAQVAIVGMAVLLPSAPDLATYWHNLVHGIDAITEVPAHRWDREFYVPGSENGQAAADSIYCHRGGFVDDLATIEVTRFGITPMSVDGTEPDQLIALSVAAQAVQDAGGMERLPARERVGVILGRGGYVAPAGVRLSNRVRGGRQLVKTLRELLPELPDQVVDRVRAGYEAQLGNYRPENAIGLVSNLSASRIANRLDLRGPAYTVDGACASSLLAIDQASAELARGRCDAVIVGGVHHVHDISFWSVFNQLKALSPSQRIQPLSRGADGTLIGEGTGVVVLKRLADAQRDDDRIYAVIRGIGVGSDGRSSSLVSPSSESQVRVMSEAWNQAGIDPLSPGAVGLIEAHGTATTVGDRAELTSLAKFFGPHRGGERPVVGAVKSMIGHTMPASGIAGLVKVSLALYHRVLLPTLNCADPNPVMAEGRFQSIDRARPWPADPGDQPRRAGVNAFGFGGINAHVVLEELPDRAGTEVVTWPPLTSPPVPRVQVREADRILRLVADTPEQLRTLLAQDLPDVLRAGLDEQDDGRGPVRIAVLDPVPRRLTLARQIVAEGKNWQGVDDVWFAPRPLLQPSGPQIAFVFPGLDSAIPAQTDSLAGLLGWPEPRSGQAPLVTRALSVVHRSDVLDTALRTLGIVPAVVCGPSLGQWSSLISAGVLRSEQVWQCLHRFEEFAARIAAAENSMDAISAMLAAPAARIASIQYPGMIITHENSPTQTVICGPREVLERALAEWRSRGVAGRLIDVPPAFHSRSLEPHRATLAEGIRSMSVAPPGATVWSASHVAALPPNAPATQVHQLLLDSLVLPVRFRQLTETLYRSGVRAFVHVGAAGLTNAIGDTLQEREHLRVDAASSRRPAELQFRAVLAALWAGGDRRYGRDRDARRLLEPVAPGRQPIALDLGAPLISLDGRTTEQFRRSLGPHQFGSAGSAPALPPVTQRPSPREAAVPTPTPTAPTASAAPVPPVTGTLVGAPRPARAAQVRPVRSVLTVSTQEMPYLRDHCFFRQRANWPDEDDRWPVVPGTTIVQHMMEIAEAANPGLVVSVVEEVRLLEWLPASPPVEVTVEMSVVEAELLEVRFGRYARARLRMAAGFPAVPLRWPVPKERRPDLTAEGLYEGRMMFHGPRFRGLTDLSGVGERHVRGTIVIPSAPGALLDNVGQLFGFWIIVKHPDRSHVLPVQIDSIQRFGRQPAPGTPIECHVRILSVSDSWVSCEAQLSVGGRVLVQIGGWRDRRFDLDRQAQTVQCFPEYEAISTLDAEGWSLARRTWNDQSTQMFVMRTYLGAAERETYAQLPLPEQGPWLLVRIAVKDAVRRWLWDRAEAGAIFPAELQVEDDGSGGLTVTGRHGRSVPHLRVDHVSRDGLALAVVRPSRVGPIGIGPTEIAMGDPMARVMGPEVLLD